MIGDTLDGSFVQATTPAIESNSPYVKQLVNDYEAIGKSESDITFGGEFAYIPPTSWSRR